MKGRTRSKSAAPQPALPAPSWSSLPPELQGRVLSNLADECRCRVIPRVNQDLLRIHRAYPPLRRHWHIHAPLNGRGMVTWFLKIAPFLESLTVTMDLEDDEEIEEMRHGALPQLLMAANKASRLRQLRIDNLGCGDGSIFYSLAFLHQITALHIHGWISYSVTDVRCLEGLRSLQEITLSNHTWDTTSGHLSVSRATWNMLAALKHLAKIVLALRYGHTHAVDSFDLASRLTHIRALSLEAFHGNWEINHRLTSSVSVLTQLTALKIGFLLAGRVRPILDLPSLRELHIGINGPAPFSLAWQSRFLTSLTVEADSNNQTKYPLQVEAALRPAASHLSRLQVLALENWYVGGVFPPSIAAALLNLRTLKLQNSSVTYFPAAISKIGTLEELWLERNPGMQLDFSNLPMLAALSRLNTLRVAIYPRQHGIESNPAYDSSDDEGSGAYIQRSLAVLLAVKSKLPHLTLAGLS